MRGNMIDKTIIIRKRIPFIIDTDTYNEIDDQFAVAYAFLAQEIFDIRGITAVPFYNENSNSPEDGMLKSYDEINKICTMMDLAGKFPVLKGSTDYLSDRNSPQKSEAVDFIIEQAESCSKQGELLYIAAIGAITNIASALLVKPELREQIAVVWLGGHGFEYKDNYEFNLRQDVAAAQVVLDSGVSFFFLFCKEISSSLITPLVELENNIGECGQIGRYLFEIFQNYMITHNVEEKVIWDISTIAAFTVPESITWQEISAPVLQDDRTWKMVAGRHMIRSAVKVNRDMIFEDFFKRMQQKYNQDLLIDQKVEYV